MPALRVDLFAGRTIEQKRALATALSWWRRPERVHRLRVLILTAALLAAASFLLVAVESFRRQPDAAFMEKMAKLGPEERGKEAIVPVTQLLINRVGTTCMNCHDHDSDPNFDLYKYWGKINHSGLAPKEGWPDKVSGKDK